MTCAVQGKTTTTASTDRLKDQHQKLGLSFEEDYLLPAKPGVSWKKTEKQSSSGMRGKLYSCHLCWTINLQMQFS